MNEEIKQRRRDISKLREYLELGGDADISEMKLLFPLYTKRQIQSILQLAIDASDVSLTDDAKLTILGY